MKKAILGAVCLLMLAGIYFWTQAGTLEPPGPPAPTMVSLEEIQAPCRTAASCGVLRTGQTVSLLAGDDGSYQAGRSASPRFTDNLDGTVTDNLTGLIWLQNGNCYGELYWDDAISAANSLSSGECGLSDGSVAGDWRLPNRNELRSLIDYGQYAPALPSDHPFSLPSLGQPDWSYWTSTNRSDSTAWAVRFEAGRDIDNFKNGYRGSPPDTKVWPVRGGL